MNRRRFLSFVVFGMFPLPAAVAGSSDGLRNPLANSNADRLLGNPTMRVRWSSSLPQRWNMDEGFYLFSLREPKAGTS